MHKNFITLGLLIIGLSSCQEITTDSSVHVHLDGRSKPKVLVLDIIDHSQSSLPWDLSLELSEKIKDNLKNFGTIYLKDSLALHENVDSHELAKQIQKKPSFDSHIVLDCEFIVAIEVIEHVLTPIPEKKNPSHPQAQSQSFSCKTRVKVFDVRHETAQLILSEIVSHEGFVPWQLSTINYKKTHYLTKQYKITPIGLGHKTLSQTIAKKIEDYVLLAKSR